MLGKVGCDENLPTQLTSAGQTLCKDGRVADLKML